MNRSNTLKRPNIQTSLVALFALMGAIILGLAIFAFVSLRTINANVKEIATDALPSVQYSKEMDTALSDLRISYNMHILAADAAAEKEADAAVTREQQRLKKATSDYEVYASDGQEKLLLKDFRDNLEKYTASGQELLTASRRGDDDAAKQILQGKMRPFSETMAGDIDKIVGLSLADTESAYEDSQATFSHTLTISIVVVISAMAAVVAAMLFCARAITRPVAMITSTMKKLAGGESNIFVPFAGRADEIGDMAAAVEVFKNNALENNRLSGEAARQRQSAEERRKASAEQERLIAEAMAKATQGLAKGLEHLSTGDLVFQLTEPFAPEFEALRANFNRTVGQLRTTMNAVAEAGNAINNGAREVSQSADDLAKRTEQQAASLEETAAALDEITVNVGNSSKRAEEARLAALQANESARHSGSIVTGAVDAMGKIEASSNQISNIIVVIDEIAFQTNLIALNAGVEAARAGEAGKGFAVVAQEVRELAQRSAAAAREIKGLITNSSVEVSGGVKLVGETGEALKLIESHIITINRHMEAIATSAREQAVGLSEVNTAVNQMDQVTQQNAAMVEEANAAGATLANEAGRLRELIGQFQLGDKEPNRPIAARAQSLADKPLASPARRMASKVTAAFGGPSQATANWEEF